MSSLLRRMQRIADRGPKAKKAALNRQFATRLAPSNGDDKPLLKPGRAPRALRRSKRSQQWLERRAEARKARS